MPMYPEVFFIYIHTLCMRAAIALVSLCICSDSPEPSMLDNTISNKISRAILNKNHKLTHISRMKFPILIIGPVHFCFKGCWWCFAFSYKIKENVL